MKITGWLRKLDELSERDPRLIIDRNHFMDDAGRRTRKHLNKIRSA